MPQLLFLPLSSPLGSQLSPLMSLGVCQQAFSFMFHCPKKFIDFQHESYIMCYFPPFVLLQGNQSVLLSIEKTYIANWSCMLLEDVMQVLPLLMPLVFVDQFIFI